MTKTLAMRLADMATPAPTTEQEPNDVFEDGAALMESDDEIDAEDLGDDGGQKRFRADIDLDDEAYRGKRTSRSEVFEPSTSMHDAGDSADDDSDGSDVDDGDSELDDDDEGVSADDGSGSDDGDGDSADDVSGRYSQDAGVDDDDLGDLEREYEEMQATDARNASDNVERAQIELTKAQAVVHQRNIWDRVLGTRIVLQKGLAAAGKLPRSQYQESAIAQSEDVAERYNMCAESCREVIGQLLDLQGELLDRNPAVASAANGDASKKRPRGDRSSSDALWQEINDVEEQFIPFRDTSVDRWHRKAMLASGRMAMKSQLRVLNQSLSQQVGVIMRDPTRAISRTRLPVATLPKRLCEPAAVPSHDDSDASEDEAEAAQPVLDAESFDDSEFYQVLLKEFLEAANVDGATMAAIKASKKRKDVDRRASKGRKIRYNVVDKMINFMVPKDSSNDDMVSSLFTNLFGQAGAN